MLCLLVHSALAVLRLWYRLVESIGVQSTKSMHTSISKIREGVELSLLRPHSPLVLRCWCRDQSRPPVVLSPQWVGSQAKTAPPGAKSSQTVCPCELPRDDEQWWMGPALRTVDSVEYGKWTMDRGAQTGKSCILNRGFLLAVRSQYGARRFPSSFLCV